jgi:hypothetical protein
MYVLHLLNRTIKNEKELAKEINESVKAVSMDSAATQDPTSQILPEAGFTH